jgi:hypothetical protein
VQKTHDTRQQVVDVRLTIHTALRSFVELGRILMLLPEAETLAVTLGDSHRLAEILAFLSSHFDCMDALDQATAAGQRALVFTSANGDDILQALENRYVAASSSLSPGPVQCPPASTYAPFLWAGRRCIARIKENAGDHYLIVARLDQRLLDVVELVTAILIATRILWVLAGLDEVLHIRHSAPPS